MGRRAKLFSLLFFIMIIGLMWSVATPVWHVPDEYEHFIYADVIAKHNTFPGDREYDLPASLGKFAAISRYSSYSKGRRFLYDGDTAPFEEDVDKVIDLPEAERLFVSLPAKDLEPVSLDLKFVSPDYYKRDKNKITIHIDYFSSRASNLRGMSYILYGTDGGGESPSAVKKSTGYVFSDGKLLSMLMPDGESLDVSDNVDKLIFSMETGFDIKIIPTYKETTGHWLRLYKNAPLYYAILAVILNAIESFNGGILAMLFFLRIFSVMLLVISSFFVYKTFCFIWPEKEEYSLAGTVLFALWPMNTFMFGAVNPANLLVLFSTISFYFVMKILFTKEHSTSDWIFFSVSTALALFTKVSAFLIIAIWWTVLLLYLRFIRKDKLRYVHFLPLILIIIGSYLFWFLKHGFAMEVGAPSDIGLLRYIKAYMLGSLRMLYASFSGYYSYLRHKIVPNWCNTVLLSFIGVIFIMFIYGLLRGFKKEERANYVYIFLCMLLSVYLLLAPLFAPGFIKLDKVGIALMVRYFSFLLLPILVIAWAALVSQTGVRIKRVGQAVGYLFVAAVTVINGVALYYYMLSNFS